MLQTAMQNAIRERAEKMKQKEWKEPVVKEYKVTAEQLMEAKLGGQRAPQSGGKLGNYQRVAIDTAPRTVAEPAATPMMMMSPAAGGVPPAVTAIVQQLERERYEFRREKEEILRGMKVLKAEMTSASSAASVPRASSSSNGASSASSAELAQIKADMERLAGRIVLLETERKNVNLELERSRARVAILENEKKSILQSVDSLLSRVDVLEAHSKNMKQEVNSLKENNNGRKKERSLTPPKAKSHMVVKKSAPVVDDPDKEAPKRVSSSDMMSYGNKSLSHLSTPAPKLTKSPAPSPTKSSSEKKTLKRSNSTGKIKVKEVVKPATTTTSKNIGEDSISLLSPADLSGSNPTLQPFSAEQMAKLQGRDEELRKYIINPDVYGAMYHRSEMSTQTVDGVRLVYFQKKIYIPEKAREKLMKHYYDTYKIDARLKLLATCIWPRVEKDYREFKLEEDVKAYKAKEARESRSSVL